MAVVVLDASILIAFFDANGAHRAEAVEALRAHERETLVLPVSAYAELLVGPLRRRAAAVATIQALLSALAVRIEPLMADIAVAAASWRKISRRVRAI